MLQRIQTVYLFLALIVTVVCLCLPVGAFTPTGMGSDTVMYNLWKLLPEGGHDFSVWPLFVILLLTCPLNLFAIFAYNNRKLQSRLCVYNVLLNLIWIAVYAVFGYVLPEDDMTFNPLLAACLPGVAIILYIMARRGIQPAEQLIRSMDRIR